MKTITAFAMTLFLLPALSSAQPRRFPWNGFQATEEHEGHDQAKPKPVTPPAHDHRAPQKLAGTKEYPAGIAPITDEDRAAAFPQLDGQHAVHDRAVHYYVLFDQLEWQGGDGAAGFNWDTKGWIGRDVNRFWFRTEGDSGSDRVEWVETHALYGRAIHRWWDFVAGIRHDLEPGPARTWAAVGVQGLAPYFFEVEATAYIGQSGRTHLRIETEYDLLLSNRLVLQPIMELDVFGRSDPERGIGAGLSSMDVGLRLRYEVRREIAPYIGVTWDRKFFGTADLAREAGEAPSGARLAAGMRLWF